MEKKNRYILEEEKKIRLCFDDNLKLRDTIMKDSGIQERVEENLRRITEYCEMLVYKYVISPELKEVYPGCGRICNRMNTINLYLFQDFNLNPTTVPFLRDFNTVSINFTKSIPELLDERNKECGNRFFSIFNRKGTEIEKRSLVGLVHEYAESRSELESVKRLNWKTLGELYDSNKEYALLMKYEVLNLVNPDEEDMMLLDKPTKELSIKQNIARVRLILGY